MSVLICLSLCIVTVRVQGEKHQEEKSQHCGVCRRCKSQPQEEEKSECSFVFVPLEKKDLVFIIVFVFI